MSGPILFINPNGLAEVTGQIEHTVRTLRSDNDEHAEFVTLYAVSGGITTQRDSDRAAVAVSDFVAKNEERASAFVICCYSDPGLHAAREWTQKPVIGMGATGVATAFSRGARVGVIAASSHGMPRHWRAYDAARVSSAVSGERAVDMDVDKTGGDAAFEALVRVGRALQVEDGADVIVLGCAGMTPLRLKLESSLGIPVIDPCSSAASLAFAICRERRIQG